jgi:hypothetical protein
LLLKTRGKPGIEWLQFSTGLPVQAIFGHYGWGMATARDVSGAVSGIRGAQKFGSEMGGVVAETAEIP